MNTLLAMRLVFALGIVNLVAPLALSLSCRCAAARTPFSRLLRTDAFAKFYSLHCYFWPVLWLSVIVHLVVAVWVLGIPFGA